jgi:hypothetical protein
VCDASAMTDPHAAALAMHAPSHLRARGGEVSEGGEGETTVGDIALGTKALHRRRGSATAGGGGGARTWPWPSGGRFEARCGRARRARRAAGPR